FDAIEAIFQRYDGRPHWGKMHTLTAETLAMRYPRWQDFLRVRQRLDPQGVFLNDYLRRLFGVDVATSATGAASQAYSASDGAAGAF
ncbi:MAG TPA: D-arabinono-1,4-lactone oxidase, partial [Ktedonobacterales bacterium]